MESVQLEHENVTQFNWS